MNNLILIISCGILFLTSFLFAWYIFRQKKACAQSRNCEKQWKSLVDNIPDILIRINHDMNIEYINPASKPLLRNSPLTYVDKPIQTLLDHEKISGITVAEIQQLFDNGKALFKELSISYENQIRHLEFRIIPEIDKNNQISTILIIGRDISKRKHTEAKLHLSKREAEDSDRLKSAFLA
ncbi:MAG: PAS domain-containing protein, partial [Bacteroidota bacterium]|nr:PAS domain-containing protein [Bacteroidota bacterium]